MKHMTAVLNEYFPKVLAQEIENVILVKPKVLTNSVRILALASAGILYIIDDSRLVGHIMNVYDIVYYIHSRVFYITFINGCIYTMSTVEDNIKSTETPPDDILQILSWYPESYYVTRSGRLWIDNKIQNIEGVVSINITHDQFYLLFVDGSVKMMDFNRTVVYVEDAELEHVMNDVVKLIINDRHSLALDINGKLIDVIFGTHLVYQQVKSKIIDVSVYENSQLELYKDGTVYDSGNGFLKNINDIISLAADSRTAPVVMVKSDGHVLIGTVNTDGHNLRTVPRLKLC